MPCPVDLWTDILLSSQTGVITQKQREDLHHLILVGDEKIAAEGLRRIKAEKQTQTQHRRSKHHHG